MGTTLGPLIGARPILSDALVEVDPERRSAPALAAQRAVEANGVALPFIGIAVTLVLLMAVFWMRRDMLKATAPDQGHGLLNM